MRDTNQESGQKVLLVDPCESTSKNTEFLLQLSGYKVTTTKALDEAVNFVSVFFLTEEGPDVILIDNFESSAERQNLIDLLADHCQHSKIIMIDRTEQRSELGMSNLRFIPPRHLLIQIRNVMGNQTIP